MAPSPFQKVNIVDENGEFIFSGGSLGNTEGASEATLTEIRDRLGSQPINGAAMPAGGDGLLGWLSAIWCLINERLSDLNQGFSLEPIIMPTDSSGTITAGAKSVAVANHGNSDGLLQGEVFPAGASVEFGAEGRDTLKEITYDATGTKFLFAIVR